MVNSDILYSGCVEEQLKPEGLDKKKRKEYSMLQAITALEERELERNTVHDVNLHIDRITSEVLGYGVEGCKYRGQ